MSSKSNPTIATMGIDIGKNSFHVVGLDRRGAIVLRQKWSRGQIEARLANMAACLIGMEACIGAHHLSRKLQAYGHDARLMPAKYVRAYSKGQKNDYRDAEAIAEAVQRPTMKFVATKRSSSARARSGGHWRADISPVMIVMVLPATTSCALTLLHHNSISAAPFCPISRTGIFFDPRIGSASSTSSLPNGNDCANAFSARQRKIVAPTAATAMERSNQLRARRNFMITSFSRSSPQHLKKCRGERHR